MLSHVVVEHSFKTMTGVIPSNYLNTITNTRGGGSGMASMAQAISIVKTVWLSHIITKRPPTLF